jgi:hypothetical protein
MPHSTIARATASPRIAIRVGADDASRPQDAQLAAVALADNRHAPDHLRTSAAVERPAIPRTTSRSRRRPGDFRRHVPVEGFGSRVCSDRGRAPVGSRRPGRRSPGLSGTALHDQAWISAWWCQVDGSAGAPIGGRPGRCIRSPEPAPCARNRSPRSATPSGRRRGAHRLPPGGGRTCGCWLDLIGADQAHVGGQRPPQPGAVRCGAVRCEKSSTPPARHGSRDRAKHHGRYSRARITSPRSQRPIRSAGSAGGFPPGAGHALSRRPWGPGGGPLVRPPDGWPRREGTSPCD